MNRVVDDQRWYHLKYSIILLPSYRPECQWLCVSGVIDQWPPCLLLPMLFWCYNGIWHHNSGIWRHTSSTMMRSDYYIYWEFMDGTIIFHNFLTTILIFIFKQRCSLLFDWLTFDWLIDWLTILFQFGNTLSTITIFGVWAIYTSVMHHSYI